MATKSIFKRWTGSAWVEFYFKTSADLIDETTNYKVMTAAERTAIGTYLTNGFNVATKLVQINAADAAQDPSKIDRSLIGDLSQTYLLKNNPEFTGTLTGNTITSLAASTLTLKQGGASSNSEVILGQGSIRFNLSGSGTAGYFTYTEGVSNTGIIDLLSKNKLTGLVGPVDTSDATTKLYVDTLVAAGLRWATGGPVKAATSVNQTILGGLLIIDGYQTLNGDRILLYGQGTTSENGIYTVGTGIWVKDTTDSKSGIMVFVEYGNSHNDWTFQATTDTTWISASKVDTILAGAGLTKTGTTLSIESNAITNAMLAGSITLPKLADFTSVDNSNASYDTWAELTSAVTSENIDVKLKNLYAAIGLSRGTPNYNTNNTETIAGAYDLAEVKNRTFTGTTETPTTGSFVVGDLYFYELA
jgi:hypothetical protein